MNGRTNKEQGKQARQIKFGGHRIKFHKERSLFGRVLEALNVKVCYCRSVNYWFNELNTSLEDKTAEF